ncbi:hypothetical protein RO3G_05539 [Rhizopus delemar RA 99-880]|uniref:Uncharacterized protein n=1 Tax=Rhizopus delemar (strain RA 99-880 / ATCC MYA-4621 / FGSC 9543 / NRRL 43880) TaxID=246409 RepID=I1BXA4_RHIO9|nr:hypothetical protein RO3G_05539 [Rhizopus delemar RA 99-880]|eukprot:EIE80834.1 hypothetical protein RO3G_05539 [Rhizopus delemar RA 99-880]
MSVVDGFGASCFRKKTFSCRNLHISKWAVAKSTCCCWSCLLLWSITNTSK